MISESKWRQYGLPNMEVKGIVLHNTNSPYSAEELERWMNEKCATSQGTHFFVDYKEIRQVMPLTWSVWNTGMGYNFGNLNCISIEVVSNPCEKKYLLAEKRAILLIRELMSKYNLTVGDIYYHRDFQPNINCPAQIIKRYPTKRDFLKEVIQ